MILDKLLKAYDRRANPTQHLGKPTSVSVEMFLRSFGSFNPATMVSQVLDYTAYGTDYEVDLYLRQSWVDERLSVSNLTHELDFNDPKLLQMIWKPEVYFPNAKEATFQYVTVPNILVRIKPNGNILYMLRLKLTFSCMMDLAKYPLDRQVCSIELASFAKTTRELKLRWADGIPVKMIDGLKLPQFELQQIDTTNCIETFSIGEYSCLRAEFLLERSVGFHLVQSYLPTTLIVVISWVSFWLDIDSIPARVTLGVTTLLTISSESTGIRANLPPVSYVKALDVWMGTCTTFVFAALIEFTVVNYLFRRKQTRSSERAAGKPEKWLVLGVLPTIAAWLMLLCASAAYSRAMAFALGLTWFYSIHPYSNSVRDSKSERSDQHPTTNHVSTVVTTYFNNRLLAKRIDRTCRIAFPMAYVLFNALYWSYYMS